MRQLETHRNQILPFRTFNTLIKSSDAHLWQTADILDKVWNKLTGQRNFCPPVFQSFAVQASDWSAESLPEDGKKSPERLLMDQNVLLWLDVKPERTVRVVLVSGARRNRIGPDGSRRDRSGQERTERAGRDGTAGAQATPPAPLPHTVLLRHRDR